MSEFKNMENELDPRLRQMLKAYWVTPERDPESARRNQERFVAILNMIFDEQTSPPSAPGWFALPGWSSILSRLRETFASSRRMRAILAGLVLLILFAVFAFGGVGMTVYAASSSLPGDTLYPLKTTIENARAGLTPNSASRARLYAEYAGQRLSEIQSLIPEGRYADIPQATDEFERDIQGAVAAVESQSQTDPARVVAVRAEIAAILRGYATILSQMLADLPGDVQLDIEGAINSSQSAAELLDFDADFNDDEDDAMDDENSDAPSPQSGSTPQLPGSPQPSPEANVTLQATAIFTPLPPANELPPPTAIPLPSATQAGSGADPVIPGGDGTCQGFLGAVTVENLTVPQGASCTLDRTRVQGNIKVENGASLTARQVTVIGNIQADGASFVEVLAGATVGGSIQLKQGGSARIENVIVNGDIQFESNNGVLSAAGNQVGGNIQVFQNVGGVTIAHNAVNGNLQCKENNPAPGGGSNTVQGNKEDQCAGL